MVLRKHSEETKRKISLACKGIHKGENNPAKRPEVRLKISQSCKGRISPRKGVMLTPSTKKKISIARIGKYYGHQNPNWRGGKIIINGYVYVYHSKLGYKFGSKYIKKADLVWYKHTGEIIKSPFIIHHKNRCRHDDSFKNLEKITKSIHGRIHLQHNVNRSQNI